MENKYPPRNKVYPWATWMDGEWHELTQGNEFRVTPETFRIIACGYARSHGMKAETRLLKKGGKKIAIRFVPAPAKIATKKTTRK